VLSAVVLVLAARGQVGSDPRACALPSHVLPSAADTAAYCAEEFVERNGYTDVIAATDPDRIAIEPLDRGQTLQQVLELRRNTIARGARLVCRVDGGYNVLFRTSDPRELVFGKEVSMGERFAGLRVVTYYVRVPGPTAPHNCTVPAPPD